jgi:type IV pilus assembly protein PilV
MKRPQSRQAGTSIIESLIAILIFSIGMLALINLQVRSIAHAGDAKYRGDAAFLANQIIGRIWADRANVANYAHNAGLTAAQLAAAQYEASSQPPANASYTGWLTNISNTLPRASANMQQILIGANGLVTVTVRWHPKDAASPHNHVAVAQIN